MSLKPAGGALRFEACRMAGMFAVGGGGGVMRESVSDVYTPYVEIEELTSWREAGKRKLPVVCKAV